VTSLHHLGDDADAAVLAVVVGDQEDALLGADVDRQGRGHGRKDDRFIEGNQEIAHIRSNFCS
jgi:hypothetical protein